MKKIYLIVGPTATGKTSIAHQIADRTNAVLINMDASLFYKDLCIGVNKPQRSYLLMDQLELNARYSPYHFVEDIAPIIKRSVTRRAIIIVGGSMWYANFLRNGFLPRFTSHLTEAQNYIRSIAHHFLTYLVLRCRQQLHTRIQQRVHNMVNRGWFHEIEHLTRQHGKQKIDKIKSIGYREGLAYLEGHITYDEFFSAVVAKNKSLAKRQMTWIRKWSSFQKIIHL